MLSSIRRESLTPVHIQLEVSQSNLNAVFALHTINIQLFKLFEADVVPTDGKNQILTELDRDLDNATMLDVHTLLYVFDREHANS